MKSIIQANDNVTSNSKQLETLKQHFPNCFDRNGSFIIDKLQAIIQSNNIAFSKEGYGINWLGKSYARLLANQNVQTLLKANTEHNQLADNVNSQNLLIKGDNLEVLKHLMGAYANKVKMIYIDPPYNTGSDGFVYQDDRKFTVEQLSQLAGIDDEDAKRILEFTQSKSNSHSAWLTFMYPRLYLARELLRDDGVIFISIDDNEQAQLKILCDEVFGEENFMANVVWQKKYAATNDAKGFSNLHDHILVYQKSTTFERHLLPRTPEMNKPYKNDDHDGKGLWRTDNMLVKSFSKSGVYPIKNPNTETEYLPPEGSSWRASKETMQIWLAENRIYFGKDGKGAPQLKRYLNEVQDGQVPTTWWKFDEVGHNDAANKEVANLFGSKTPFDTPKPTSLICQMLKIATEKNSLILDFFAGSGTTAHAVMQLNAEDGGNRQFICVQIDEATDPKSEAYKAGYKTIYDITAERIKRAAKKIKAEHPEAKADFGFKQFETIPVFEGYLDEPDELTAQLTLFNADKLSHEERHDLMLTWQAHDGIPLYETLTPLNLAGYTVYQTKDILYFIEPNPSMNTVIQLLEQLDNNPHFAPRRLIVLGYLLDSKIQREMTEAVKHYNNRKGIELTLDIRF